MRRWFTLQYLIFHLLFIFLINYLRKLKDNHFRWNQWYNWINLSWLFNLSQFYNFIDSFIDVHDQVAHVLLLMWSLSLSIQPITQQVTLRTGSCFLLQATQTLRLVLWSMQKFIPLNSKCQSIRQLLTKHSRLYRGK